MKNIKVLAKTEKAQVLPWLVIGILVIIIMSALLVDGGTLLANRRQAQNAADAGALAGARVYCDGGSEDAIEAAITQYVTENDAVLVDWYPTSDNVGNDEDDIAGLIKGEVVVTTTIVQNSFFARVMDEDFLTVEAIAGAGCFSYQPKVVLPIAWSCRPPVAGSYDDDCDIIKLDYDQVKDIADDYIMTFPEFGVGEPEDEQSTAISEDLFTQYGDKIYIVMDSDAVCGEDINCEIFTEGRDQLLSGDQQPDGNRGWLNLLADSSGTPNLEGLIDGTLVAVAKVHTWYSGVDGNRPSVYTAIKDRIDEIVWIPVFNAICFDLVEGVPADSCMYDAHDDPLIGEPLPTYMDEDLVLLGNPATPAYHIISFTPFFVTCVEGYTGSASAGNHCPGFSYAMSEEINPDVKQSDLVSINYMEGYFVNPDTIPPSEDIAFGGIDMGYYTISLTR